MKNYYIKKTALTSLTGEFATTLGKRFRLLVRLFRLVLLPRLLVSGERVDDEDVLWSILFSSSSFSNTLSNSVVRGVSAPNKPLRNSSSVTRPSPSVSSSEKSSSRSSPSILSMPMCSQMVESWRRLMEPDWPTAISSHIWRICVALPHIIVSRK